MKSALTIFCLVLFACSEGPTELASPDLTFQLENLKLTIKNDSLPADGKAYNEISILVGKSVVKSNKEVKLTVSPIGKFQSFHENTITLSLSTEGRAKAYVSSDQEGIAYVTATIDDLTSTISAKFYDNDDPGETFAFSQSANSQMADSYSTIEFVVTADDVKSYKGQEVVFTTDKGLFTNESRTINIVPDVAGTAKAYLKSSKAETTHIGVKVLGAFESQLVAEFTKTEPTSLKIESGVSYLTASLDSQLSLTAILSRTPGIPSEGQNVQFYDSAANGASIGIFLNTSRSKEFGNVDSQYHLQDSAYTGFVYLKAYFTRDNGTILRDSVKVVVTKP